MNYNEIYRIYSECFPDILSNFDAFLSNTGLDDNSSKVIAFEEKAFAVYQKNALILLCVGKVYRHQGIATKLLKQVEEIIQKNYDKIILGHTDSHYLYPGVPTEEGKAFFIKNGYNFDWEAVDMLVEIDNSIWRNVTAYDGNDFDFRFKTADDNEAIKVCGDNISSGWGDLYVDSDSCLLAIEKSSGELAGAIIVDEDNPYNLSLRETGGFGCVGVCERFRKFGLGMRLCKEALVILSEKKIKKCFIGYTDLVSWYGKLGAKPIIKYAMGEKKFYL
jgi:GNAT superfamily N-acetyltransferase